MSLTRHTAYNLAGTLVPLGLSLLTIPAYVHLIGEARYGVLAIAWLLLGYFGLFDLGLGRATAQSIASLGEQSRGKQASIFWTALATNITLGCAGGMVLLLVSNLYFGDLLSLESGLKRELVDALPWLAAAVPIVTATGVLAGAMEARSKFLELNLISVMNSSLIQLVPLGIAYFHSPTLVALLSAVICVRLVGLTLLSARCHLHICRGHPVQFSKQHIRQLMAFGGWVTVTSVIGPLMTVLDRFVIGVVLGARAVAYYTVPFQLAERTTILARSLSSSLFPRLARASVADARPLAEKALRTLVAITSPLILCGIFIIQPFLSHWLSPAFAASSQMAGPVLLFGFWVNGAAAIPYAQLQASGRPNVAAKCHIAEVLPYFLCLFLGMRWYGLTGAAIAFAGRALVDCMLLMYLAGSPTDTAKTMLKPGLLLVAGVICVHVLPIGAVPWWAAFIGLTAICLFLVRSDLPHFIRTAATRRSEA